jgi:hypothetical protein
MITCGEPGSNPPRAATSVTTIDHFALTGKLILAYLRVSALHGLWDLDGGWHPISALSVSRW